MQKVSLYLTLSLTTVAFIVGLTAGFYISPQYQQTMYTKTTMDLGRADAFVDLRYLNSMAAHHMGAILLAQQIEEKTQRPELIALSREIQTSEPRLIAELYAWKSEWYNDKTAVAKPQVAQLGAADETVDLRFLNALIAHHEAGIQMTKEIRLKSSRPEVLDNADAVEKFLTQSLVDLQQMRSDWFNQ